MVSRIVGVDVGNDVLRAVEVADFDKPRPTVLRYHQTALPEGAVQRGEVIEPNTVSEALKHLWKSGGFTSKRVVLGVGNQRVFARELTVPKAPIKHIRESLPFQVQDMLPVPVADALLDFYPVAETVTDHGMPGIRGLLVAAVKEAVANKVLAAKLAGLTVVDVDLIPFAVSRVLVSRPGLAGGVVLVDIGANTTSVVMAADGIPQFVRIIPAGGEDVTRALQSEYGLDTQQADAAKRRLGLGTNVAPEDQPYLETIYRVTGELLNSLRNTVSFFANTRPDQAIGQIVLNGGGSRLTGLAENLSRVTGLPVTLGDPLAAVKVSPKLTGGDIDRDRVAISAALGLAVGSAA
ncbi:type IV pilus assembly protein PilM [Leifsonia xyli]|uniref:type IV pilus assembly protein PilM n=1 Tax=Leifsonia xyli TaxID=1575 RepID=UPI003D67193D